MNSDGRLIWMSQHWIYLQTCTSYPGVQSQLFLVVFLTPLEEGVSSEIDHIW